MARPPLTAPILGDPSRSDADPYDLHSDLIREEPVMGSERRGRAVHGRLEVNPDLFLRKTRRVAEELTCSCRLLGVVVVVV